MRGVETASARAASGAARYTEATTRRCMDYNSASLPAMPLWSGGGLPKSMEVTRRMYI